MRFQNGQCVQDKDKKKYEVKSSEENTLATRYGFSTDNPEPPKQYTYELENAKTGVKETKLGSLLENCSFDKKIEKGNCVKKSGLGPGYIVKSISQEPPFELTLEDKETKEESTKPIEDYYHCSFSFLKNSPFLKKSQSNNLDTNTKQQPTDAQQQAGPAGGKRRTRKAKKSKKRGTKKAKKSAKRKSRKSRR
jgi:hypothetical protein